MEIGVSGGGGERISVNFFTGHEELVIPEVDASYAFVSVWQGIGAGGSLDKGVHLVSPYLER